jgi:hypothetical protein
MGDRDMRRVRYVDSAPNRLVHALDRILAYRTPLKVLPVVEEFLRDMAPYEPPEAGEGVSQHPSGDPR